MTDRIKPIQDCLAYTARQYADVLQARDILAGKLANAESARDAWWRQFNFTSEASIDRERYWMKRVAALEAALRKISLGEGRFSLDHNEHARNTIEDMKAVAAAALTPAETITRSGTAPSENVKTQDQPRPDAPYGKPCTCDNSLGSSIPCYVESGGRLGALWYCEKRQRLAVQSSEERK